MKTRFFISALPLHGSLDWIMEYVEAESFDEALQMLHTASKRRFGSRPYRPTSVTEQPDIGLSGPITLAMRLGGEL